MFLEIKHLTKHFGQEKVLNALNFTLEERRILSILGKSGSGKTTLLKIIAGLERADEGIITLNDEVMNDVPPHRRNMVYLYQEPLLFPHLNVFENVAFGLRLRKENEKIIQEKVLNLLAELELNNQQTKMPTQLSGGQRQRVAFGRALIINPKVLLLDEPFGALDAETRQAMQQLLKKIIAEHSITTIFVTHDLKEAIVMGDRIGIMEKGRLEIYGSKKDFIDRNENVRGEIEFWKGL
ncbi:MAG: ABC transporter ATP-binding protein [Saprospiraceae bacterium]